MDYEKLHKETIAKLQEMVNSGKITAETARGICADFVPESEDERLRKGLIELVDGIYKGSSTVSAKEERDRYVAWLEKQGEQKPAEWHREDEQNLNACLGYISDEFLRRWLTDAIHAKYDKPTDKVGPKFHKGDWVVTSYGKVNQVVSVDKDGDGYTLDDGVYFSGSWKDMYHLWTIEDAKDGDVLCCESGWTCIFKALDNHTNTFSSYCFMDNESWFCRTGVESHTLDKTFIRAYNGEIYPATKQQCDTLMKAMADAGYAWDAEKKELRKIEQKSAWSEEDENRINRLIAYFEDKESFTAEDDIVYANWLKSLKDRVQPQPKQEWSEEDKCMLNNVVDTLKPLSQTTHSGYAINSMIDWLKSLRPQKQQQEDEWSDEDKEFLELTLSNLAELKDRYGEGYGKVGKCIDWLKSLQPQPIDVEAAIAYQDGYQKALVEFYQKHQEWTDDDINMIDWLIRCCEKEHEELCNDRYGHQDIVSDLKRDCRKKWDWLESLKEKVAPQKQWKPSEEHLRALEIVGAYKDVTQTREVVKQRDVINNLLEQLKAL